MHYLAEFKRIAQKDSRKWNDCSVVLYQGFNESTPYVTWIERNDDGSRSWGHYFNNYDDAIKDFNARA